ncbi:uncharacterized protein [Procambarus clarkii]|uniref:uncharacterized protein n=1 Tax=Procambarus clarkii TaxID=6728 RepID=UPI0037436983
MGVDLEEGGGGSMCLWERGVGGAIGEGGGPQNDNSLRVCCTSGGSLRSKIGELGALVCTEKMDIVALAETWMSVEGGELLAECQIYGFKLFRTDRYVGRGGGVAIYVGDGLKCGLREGIEAGPRTEAVWIELSEKANSIVIGVMCGPPSLDRVGAGHLWDEVSRASGSDSVCVMGDFSFGGVGWLNGAGSGEAEDFLELVDDCFLAQHIGEPAREGNILDLVLTSREARVGDVEMGSELGSGGRRGVRFGMEWSGPVGEGSVGVPDFREADFGGLGGFLGRVDWGGLGVGCGPVLERDVDPAMGDLGGDFDVDSICDLFENVLDKAQERGVPCKLNRSCAGDPKWMTGNLGNLVGGEGAWYKGIEGGEVTLERGFVQLVGNVREEMGRARGDCEVRIAGQAGTGPKGFFQLYRAGTGEGMGPLKTETGQVADGDGEMSGVFDKYFVSVFAEGELDDVPSAEQVCVGGDGDGLTSLAVAREDVLRQMVELRPNRSPGPDEVFAGVLGECKEELCDPLSTMFGKSMESGGVPEFWRVAGVMPVFGKGDGSLASGCRPIGLASVVGGLLESIMANGVRLHLGEHELIVGSRRGFVNGRSCLAAVEGGIRPKFGVNDSRRVRGEVGIREEKSWKREAEVGEKYPGFTELLHCFTDQWCK